MILAALNIGRILINFFYAEKLQLCGINETWLAAIIMGYSAIQLLSERILARTKPEHYNQMMALFFILSGIALGVLGLVNVPVWTILFMLILPLFLDIPSYLLGEVQNSIVDAAGGKTIAPSCFPSSTWASMLLKFFICLAHHYW